MAKTGGASHRGNRVFHIDEECYVIYLGSEGHGVRPFLRIGTSPFIPEQIKRHIGSVVISDHLTGDFLIEAECLDTGSMKHTRYVGTKSLVDAVKHYVHREQIPYQELEPVREETPQKGGQVLFYDDGNLRVFLDGHRLFDLSERERSDRHGVFRDQRLHDLVSASRGSYRTEDLGKNGFLFDGRRGTLFFSEGYAVLGEHGAEDGLAVWAKWGLSPVLISGLAAPHFTQTAIELYKFRLAAGLSCASFRHEPGEVAEALAVFRAAGLRESTKPFPDHPDDLPIAHVDPRGDASLRLPPGHSWMHGVTPPLLPGVVYRYDDYTSELEYRHLLTGELRKRVDTAEDPDAVLTAIADDSIDGVNVAAIDRTCAALWLWNRHSGSPEADATSLTALAERVVSALAAYHIPTIAMLRHENDQWFVRLRPRSDLSRSAIADNVRMREKIATLLESTRDRGAFEAERERLKSFLNELLAAHRVAHAPPTAADTTDQQAKPTEQRDGTSKHESGTDATNASKGSTDRSSAASASDSASKRSAGPQTLGSSSAASSSAGGGVGRTGGRTGGRKALWALAILAVLVIAAVLLVPRIPSDSAASIASSVEEDGVAGEASPDSDETTSDGADGAVGADASGDEAREPSGETDASRRDDAAGSGIEDETTPSSSSTESASRDSETVAASSDDASLRSSSEAGSSEDGSPREDPRALPRSDLDGQWTILDVLRVTNWIAQENGYRPIGADDLADRPDPDWIFPGNTFRLPDGAIHRVVAGETLWSISAGFLSEIFLATHMELSRFRDLIDSNEYPVEELERHRRE